MCKYCETPTVIPAGKRPEYYVEFERDTGLPSGTGGFSIYLCCWEGIAPGNSRWTLHGISFEEYSSCDAFFCPVCGRELPQD